MGKIAVIGSTNMDFISYGPRMPSNGETIEASKFKVSHGGKGANQAIAAGKLGSKVTMISKVGDDIFGEDSLSNFLKYEIDITHINKTKNTPTGTASIFVNEKTSQNSISIIKGANSYLKSTDIDAALDLLNDTDIILIQLEIPLDTVYYVIELSKIINKKIILNPAPAYAEIDIEKISKCDFIIPNESELSALSGMAIKNLDDVKHATEILIQSGFNQVIVTLGDKGCYWASKDNDQHFEPNKVLAKDSSGAGDAFIGSFAHYLSETDCIESAIKSASIYSSISVTKEGTQSSYPKKEDLE